ELAVEVDLQGGVLEGFLDARIGNSGNLANLRQQFVCKSANRVEVIACDLNIERGWGAEVENLADDIRRKERKGRAWKGLRKLRAQSLGIGVGRGRPLAQSHEHVGVENADRPR